MSETVTLRTGHVEAATGVRVVQLHLRSLLSEHPVAFLELVTIARDRNHEPFGATGEWLRQLQLLDHDGHHHRMHESVRNIILACVAGDGLDMHLVSPTGEALR